MSALTKYNAAITALAEAKAVDEVKDLRDKAEAMRVYAQQAQNKTLEVDAAEIRIRAERRLGEMIAAQKAAGAMNTGTRGQLAGKAGSGEVLALAPDEGQKKAPTLADVGISYDLSSRAQKLAAVPEAQFEAEVGDWRERVTAENARVTTRLEQAGAKAQQEQQEPEEREPTALEISEMENDELRNEYAALQIAIANGQLDEEDLYRAQAYVDDMHNHVKALEAELAAIKASRDADMEEIRQLKTQCRIFQAKIKKLEGRVASYE